MLIHIGSGESIRVNLVELPIRKCYTHRPDILPRIFLSGKRLRTSMEIHNVWQLSKLHKEEII